MNVLDAENKSTWVGGSPKSLNSKTVFYTMKFGTLSSILVIKLFIEMKDDMENI